MKPNLQELAAAGGAELLDKLLAEKSLRHFVRTMWHEVEPKRALTRGWLIDAICEHLEAVAKGQITRLIINVPPGCAKSLISSVFFPAWIWGPLNRPETRFICASFAQGLAIRDNGRFRAVVGSDLFRKHWGASFTISDKDDSKIKIGNDKTGWKEAGSVGGLTGARGDILILDDPNSIDEAESEKIRASTNTWLRETLPTRLNDPAKTAIVVIQQRLHEEDATGTLVQDGDNWTWLCVPMEYDADRHCTTSIGWTDPRKHPGELCFPERFPRWVVDREKAKMGPYAIAGQYQQMPTTRGGEILQRDWWQTWGDPENGVGAKFPAFTLTIGVLDSAHTTKDSNDPSGFMVLGVFASPQTGYPQVMLARAWCKRLAIHDLVTEVDTSCRKYRVDTLIIENKANGIDVENELQRMFGRNDYGVTFTRFSRAGRQGNDKVARAFSIAPLMANGLLWRPITDWSEAVVDQCAIFPRGAHDEYVDCLTHGLRWLRDQGVLETAVEVRDREAYMSRPVPRSHRRPVYRT